VKAEEVIAVYSKGGKERCWERVPTGWSHVTWWRRPTWSQGSGEQQWWIVESGVLYTAHAGEGKSGARGTYWSTNVL